MILDHLLSYILSYVHCITTKLVELKNNEPEIIGLISLNYKLENSYKPHLRWRKHLSFDEILLTVNLIVEDKQFYSSSKVY